jgi:hypothetical protein
MEPSRLRPRLDYSDPRLDYADPAASFRGTHYRGMSYFVPALFTLCGMVILFGLLFSVFIILVSLCFRCIWSRQ